MSTASVRARSPRIVQSRQNARVKELRAGFRSASRTEHGHIAIEGEHLLLEAIAAGLTIPAVFIRQGSESLLDHLQLPDTAEIIALPPDIFASAVSTESPQGIAALVDPPAFTLDHILNARGTPLILIAAGLQDPGNLGTLIRSAEAFAATGLITLPGTVSPWNQKALRASAGSVFRLPVIACQRRRNLPRARIPRHRHPSRRRPRYRYRQRAPSPITTSPDPPRSSSATKAPASRPKSSTAPPPASPSPRPAPSNPSTPPSPAASCSTKRPASGWPQCVPSESIDDAI